MRIVFSYVFINPGRIVFRLMGSGKIPTNSDCVTLITSLLLSGQLFITSLNKILTMKYKFLFSAALAVLLVSHTFSQLAQTDTVNQSLNAAGKLLGSGQGISLGGYAQIDYNQPFGNDTRANGMLDVHRLVLLFGYQFTEKTSFISELELEHVEEVYVEQAFLQHRFTPWLNLRAGLMLIPMGRTNEYHEPPVFNGVERPILDNNLSPTTWRELGIGFSGQLAGISSKYQVYLVNGFLSYNEEGLIGGKSAFRSGRQKGIESAISSPNLALRYDFYGIQGLQLGLSGYFGKTQSTLYNGIDKSDEALKARADSSVVGIAMAGLDAVYQYKGLSLKGQLYLANCSNTEQYNAFAGKDMGSVLAGYYAEAGYNVLSHFGTEYKLVPFVRYTQYNLHYKVESPLEANKAYTLNEVIGGLGWWLHPGAVLKADVAFTKRASDDKYTKVFNAGVGIWF